MKCAYYQKQKQTRMTAKDKQQLNEIVGNFMEKLITVGTDKALEIMQEESEKKEEEN
jgi:hypothetical protein